MGFAYDPAIAEKKERNRWVFQVKFPMDFRMEIRYNTNWKHLKGCSRGHGKRFTMALQQ